MNKYLHALVTLASLSAAATLAGCGGSDKASAAGAIAITATDDACQVATTSLTPGKTTFAVTNKGSKTTEVYIYGQQDGKYSKIVSEVENIGPGTSRDLITDLSGGTYEIACKPGQTGDGIRTKVTVEGPKASEPATASAYDREIEIEATDTTVEPADDLTGKTGEKIELKLKNMGTKKRVLEIIDPAGKIVTEFEVEAGKTGETVVTLSTAGMWKLKVEGGDKEAEKSISVA